jgi:hypothetical protein
MVDAVAVAVGFDLAQGVVRVQVLLVGALAGLAGARVGVIDLMRD